MGRYEEAEKALCWLRGWASPRDIQKELQEVTAAVKADAWVTTPDGNHLVEKLTAGLQKFKQRSFIRPFFLIVTCFFIGNFTGVSSLATFAVNIFASLGSPIDRYYATCLLGVAQIIGSLTCACIIHTTGKRPLAIASTLGNGVFFAAVAFYAFFYAEVYTLDNGESIKTNFPDDSNELSWVPLVGLVGGALCAYTGARLLPWIIIGEVFPSDIRGLASGVTASMFYVFGFAANKLYFTCVDYLTLPGTYWLHSAVALMAGVFYYFCLPETEGWSLHEVEEHFKGERNLIKAGKKSAVKSSIEAGGKDNLGMTMRPLD